MVNLTTLCKQLIILDCLHSTILFQPIKTIFLVGSWSTWWTPSYLGDSDQMTRLSETSSRCHHLSSCSFTTDRSSLNLSSLVVFSYSDINLLDMPPKYLLGQKWALFLPTPTQRHSSSSTWSHYLPMFDLLISYFPQSSVPMNQAKVVSYSSIGPINDSSISGISDVKFRKVWGFQGLQQQIKWLLKRQ